MRREDQESRVRAKEGEPCTCEGMMRAWRMGMVRSLLVCWLVVGENLLECVGRRR